MPRYAALLRPAANRVFGGAALDLLCAELAFASSHLLDGALRDVAPAEIAGVGYVTFTTHLPLEGQPVVAAVVANAASTYAVFERIDGADEALLRPLRLPRLDRFDDDLVTTQRYVGKTNETVTKLLVNLALHAAPGTFGTLLEGGRVRILDPLCGRGTTGHQALLYGADALGVDLDARDTDAYRLFLRTWLEDKRLKHQVDASAGRGRFRILIGRKGAAAADTRQVVDVVTADTVAGCAALGRNSADLIVTDLPYGVQHGSRSGGEAALQRRPDALLETALPAWRAALRPGGACALSWNLKVLPRAALEAALERAGFAVCSPGEAAFVHRVDRAITRDIVVARPA